MQPKRGDGVEQWIKIRRNGYPKHSSEWVALDELLDDYRLLADIGKPLGEEHLKVEDIEDLRDSLPKKFNGGRTDAF